MNPRLDAVALRPRQHPRRVLPPRALPRGPPGVRRGSTRTPDGARRDEAPPREGPGPGDGAEPGGGGLPRPSAPERLATLFESRRRAARRRCSTRPPPLPAADLGPRARLPGRRAGPAPAALRGYRTGIISNLPWGSPPALWREEVGRLGVAGEVDEVVFCGDAGYRKPAPRSSRTPSAGSASSRGAAPSWGTTRSGTTTAPGTRGCAPS